MRAVGKAEDPATCWRSSCEEAPTDRVGASARGPVRLQTRVMSLFDLNGTHVLEARN